MLINVKYNYFQIYYNMIEDINFANQMYTKISDIKLNNQNNNINNHNSDMDNDIYYDKLIFYSLLLFYSKVNFNCK